ncbi:MAG: hypothetical protein II063_00145, partial [Prevotella sp.]|nr:hypothetical protein [Prevotella sp.]
KSVEKFEGGIRKEEVFRLSASMKEEVFLKYELGITKEDVIRLSASLKVGRKMYFLHQYFYPVTLSHHFLLRNS